MIRGLAIPYEKPSRPGVGNSPFWCEVISRFAFRESVQSARSVKTGRPIFACWGHRRNGRKKWKIADTTNRLRLWEEPDGVHFAIDGVKLPLDFTGVSVRLEALAWRRESDLLWRLKTGGIRHIAILTGDSPAYSETFIETIRASTSLPQIPKS
jgi:hypothetical protein